MGPGGGAGRWGVCGAVARVGIADFAGRRSGERSGGKKQGGSLGRALVGDPHLLRLDEPFKGLDRENREVLLSLVQELRAEGRTIIVSTHDLEIAKRACTHVLLLASGHTPTQPGHPAAFGSLDEALTLEAVAHAFQDTTVELDHHTVTTSRELE